MTDIASLAIRVDSLEAKTAKDRLSGMNREARNSAKGMDALATRAKQAAAGIALLAGVGVIAFFRSSAREAAKFGASVSALSAITGATGRDLEFLSDKAKEFGATTTLSASQAAEAFQLVASAKPDLLENAAALAAVTRESIRLAEATGEPLKDAAETLGTSLNQFKKGAEDAARFTNVLAAGSQKGASLVRETAEALKYAGTTAGQAGASFEQVNAAVQVLSQIGLKGSEAGTALRNVFLKLTTQTNDEFNPAIVGLQAALENLREAQLPAADLLRLFGARSIVAAKELITNADAVEEMTDRISETSIAMEQANTRVDNLEGDLLALASAWEAVRIAVGENMQTPLRDTTSAMTDILRAINLTIDAGNDLGEDAFEWGTALKVLATILYQLKLAGEAAGLAVGGLGAAIAFVLQDDYSEAANVFSAFLDDLEKQDEKLQDFRDRLFEGTAEDIAKAQKDAAAAAAAIGADTYSADVQVTVNADTEGATAAAAEKAAELSQVFTRALQESRASIDEEFAIELDVADQIADLQAFTAQTAEEEQRRIAEVERIRADGYARLQELRLKAQEEELAASRELADALTNEESALDEEAAIANDVERRVAALMEMTAATEEEELRRQEIIAAIREEGIARLDELNQRQTDDEAREYERRHRLYYQALARRKAALTDLEKFERKSWQAKTQTALTELIKLSQGVAQENKVLFAINKAAALANAVISMPEHVSKTMAKYPYPLSVAMGAAAAAASLAQINAIRGTSYEGGGAGTTPSLAGSQGVINDTPVDDSLATQDQLGSAATNQNATQIVVTGNYGFTPEVIDEIAEGLNEATRDRDIVIIDSDSRQAQEIQQDG